MISMSFSASSIRPSFPGVSILVGRLEVPPYEEKVIQMMFDVDVWSEESAYKW